MAERVGIIGLGYAGFSTTGASYKELMFEAAMNAYEDAGIDARKDIQSFICCTEDFWEGNSIADEYMPDQLGAAQRPLCTISADGLYGIITGYMQIKSGLFDIVVVESHSKLSNVINKDDILRFALDPVYVRSKINPYFIAGMEMNRFLHESKNSREACAIVASKNYSNALRNPRGSYARRISSKNILVSKMLSYPLTAIETSKPIDGCIVIVLASERKAKTLSKTVWVRGVGWCSSTPCIESLNFDAEYASISSRMAYRMADIDNPRKAFDLAEIDDTFSYKEIQHMEALSLCNKGEADKLVKSGYTARDGTLPVNPSGGSLGVGDLVEAKGLHKVLEASLQLRGEAKEMQIKNARRALVQSWRGIPTASGAVVILER